MASYPARRGMTFVELLVAMALSLILIYGMALAFGRVGQAASDGRAKIEMANQTRNVMHRLQLDLEGVTVPMRNWTTAGGAHGYFEVIEGPRKEYTDLTNLVTAIRLIGDIDDVLMMTTRSQAEPFRGRIVGATGAVAMVESPTAEVIYAATPIDTALTSDTDPRNIYLHRRALLIRPDLNQPNGFLLREVNSDITVLETRYLQFINANDISARISLTAVGGGLQMDIIANSLEDLSVRENRFAHRPLRIGASPLFDNIVSQNFPHTIFDVLTSGAITYNIPFRSMFNQSDSVLMSHTIGFDVKVYDPAAPIFASADGTTAIQPTDPGFFATPSLGGAAIINPAAAGSLLGRGAFVDLGYARAAMHDGLFDDAERQLVRSNFSDWPEFDAATGADKSGLKRFALPGRNTFTYDTWTDFYERNNQNEGDYVIVGGTAVPLIDEGNDGVDNNGVGGIDEFAEQETAPPYAAPLRGLKVILRLYESDTRQIRQMSVVNDFIPE